MNSINRALELWIELTGVDPNQKGFRFRDYSVGTMHEAIREALELDPSNITAYLLLDSFSASYFQGKSFSIQELLESPDSTESYLKTVREFLSIIKSPVIRDLGDSFRLTMRQAIRHYRADTEKVMEVLADPHALAFIRRDALRSINDLRVDQFLAGEPESKEIKPACLDTVHQLWNVNSLINMACSTPSGVTLNLIRDPDDFNSFFAFTIRNGGNLFILSDVPVHAHPLAKFMSRRPDRALGDRACRNWFPYELLGVKFDSDSGDLYIERSNQNCLIPIQQTADPLKRINELDPVEIIWTVMMFDLIAEKFWNKGHQEKELSYTASMIKEESPLIEEAERSNLPVPTYDKLNLPALRVADIRSSTIKEGVLGSNGGEPYKWMEERYASSISDEYVNLISMQETNFYLPPPSNSKKFKEHKNHDSAAVSKNNIVSVGHKDNDSIPTWHSGGRLGLHAVDPSTFGTRVEVDSNRQYLARHNLAKGVQHLAIQEFNNRQDEIMKWWKGALEQNIDHLFSLAINKVWWRKKGDRYKTAKVSGVGGVGRTTGEYRMMYCYNDDEFKKDTLYHRFDRTVLSQGYSKTHLCYLTGVGASYRVVFEPQTADDLAFLVGCDVGDLPDVLQHWCANSRSQGNHNINRVDPMAWAINNPWEQMSMSVLLALSKRGYNRIKKEFAGGLTQNNHYLS